MAIELLEEEAQGAVHGAGCTGGGKSIVAGGCTAADDTAGAAIASKAITAGDIIETEANAAD